MIFDALGALTLGAAPDTGAILTGGLMAILTAEELAAMRGDIELLMPDTCTINQINNTADGAGGFTKGTVNLGTSICRLDVIQGREQLTGGAIQAYTHYMLSLPWDETVAYANQIQVSSINYAVKSVNLGQSWKGVVRVELERL
jgi:hypothetical protein